MKKEVLGFVAAVAIASGPAQALDDTDASAPAAPQTPAPCVTDTCAAAAAHRMVDPSTIPGVMDQPKRVFPPTAFPAAKGNFIGLSTENGRIAWNFIDMAFNQKRMDQAFDKYIARTGYFDHNSSVDIRIAEGIRGFGRAAWVAIHHQTSHCSRRSCRVARRGPRNS